MRKLSEIKEELSELAALLNQFKSEAVQLRLLEFIFEEHPVIEGKTHAARPRKRSATQTKSLGVGAIKAKTPSSNPKKGSGGNGATATLNGLVAGDFFNTHRTIGDTIEHAKHNLARTFKPNEFSGQLARLIRSKRLTRQKNEDGQYEYKKT